MPSRQVTTKQSCVAVWDSSRLPVDVTLDGALLGAGVYRALHTGDGRVPNKRGASPLARARPSRDDLLTRHGKSRWAQTGLRLSGDPG